MGLENVGKKKASWHCDKLFQEIVRQMNENLDAGKEADLVNLSSMMRRYDMALVIAEGGYIFIEDDRDHEEFFLTASAMAVMTSV